MTRSRRAVCARLLALCVALVCATLPMRSFAAVAPRTVAARETFDAGTLRVERFGYAGRPALILIPALYCGSWQWNATIAALASSFDIYAVTLSGMDGRPRDDAPALGDRAVRDVARLIRERRLRDPLVIGHSLGGTLAVLFGERYPRLAAGIIAVEGGYPVATDAAERRRGANALAARFDHADAATFDRVLRTTQLRYVITRPADVNAVARRAERSDPTAVAAWLRDALDRDLTPGLGAIVVPFREIVPFDASIDPYAGDKTLAAKRARYAAWVAHAPRGSVATVAGARHFVMFDRPRAFEHVLRATIAQFESSRTISAGASARSASTS